MTTASHHKYDASTSLADERIAKLRLVDSDVFHDVKIDQLPNYGDLKKQVDMELKQMTWWESYGIDNITHFLAVVLAVGSFFIMQSNSTAVCFVGVFLLGCCHNVLAVKGGHLAAHKAVVQSAPLNRLMGFFFLDICGTFPSDTAHVVHIKEHHPYTNVIGIGDSSTWKAPFVPAYMYMFVTPLLVPIITPVVSVLSLWGKWLALCRFLLLAGFGISSCIYLFMNVSGFSFLQAVGMLLASRMMLSIPYIHVNIFQHIGLPMFTLKDKPMKIYQMSTGVLNLPRNLILDICFGHSIMSAHVEHHLFPFLSDQQCLRIKPIVRRFLAEHGLAYNEASYTERLSVFLNRYPYLMKLTPPISHFVGLQ